MPEAFVTSAKTPGTCVVCGKGFNAGEPLHMHNLGDETNKKWIVSPHEECFKKLEADPGLMKQGQFAKKTRSPEERFNDAVSTLDKLWTACWKKAEVILGEVYGKDGYGGPDIRKEKLILAEVLLKAGVEVYSR